MGHLRKAELLTDRGQLNARIAAWREMRQIVALVPTMGALHEGHLSLVQLAAGKADRILVTIFVNPAQFAPTEDFSAYPRSLEADREKLGLSADAIYCPPLEDIYPPGFCTTISLAGPAAAGLEDRFRPTHFSGVATVVAKLFAQTQPHMAVFGEKDYQQLCVVRQMARDLDLNVDVIGAPTIRSTEGLALSSRNSYLSEKERALAPRLHQALQNAAAALREGRESQAALSAEAARLSGAGFALDYFEWRRADNLAPAQGLDQPTRLLVAARLGKTRLIDNIAL